jgi:hypothetical protein
MNAGERHVAEELRVLDDEWTIYVQPRIAQDIPDFVAVHDRHGVCAVEVKDWSRGQYRHTDGGVIEYTNHTGAWFTTKEKPRYQAYRYRSTIFDQFFALPEDGAEPTSQVRAVVVLPNFSTDDARKLLSNAQVTPREQAVAVYGGDGIGRAIAKDLNANCATPHPASLSRLRRLLIEPASADRRAPVKLSADARNIASNPSGARRRRVRGPAGSGKSFGLAARAARLAADHQSVLVLTFNVTLANYLRALVNDRCREIGANPTLVTCVNFHAFCQRVVEDAKQVGMVFAPSGNRPWYEVLVDQARDAMSNGLFRRFDAVLIDEGQDFSLEWWNFLRDQVVVPGGEMLLVADPTQDLYDTKAWTDEQKMLGAGFSGPWSELKGSYRMPTDMVPIANTFAAKYLDGEHMTGEVPIDHMDLFGAASATIRYWENNDRPADQGSLIGQEVIRLLSTYADLSPTDVAFLCDNHDAGLDAVSVIEAAGYPVHHIFARDQQSKTRRKQRFWPDAPGVKGCTVHSFKGWETPALVMGIGSDTRSKRLAYVALTRIRVGGPGRPAYVSVINSDLRIAGFDSVFRQWATPAIPLWAPPRADDRVG